MAKKRTAPAVKGRLERLLRIIPLLLLACALVVAEIVVWPFSSQHRKALSEGYKHD